MAAVSRTRIDGRHRRRESARHVEHHQERHVEDDDSRATAGRRRSRGAIAIFVTSVIPVGEIETPKPASTSAASARRRQVEHRWMVYAIDFATGKIAWEREVHRGVPPQRPAPQEHVRVGNTGHRRHSASTRHSATSASSPSISAASRCGRRRSILADAQRLGHGALLRCFTTAVSISSTTTRRRSYADRARRGHRARRSGGSSAEGNTNWATPFIWRHAGRTEIVTTGTERDSLVRSRRQAAVAAAPMSSIVIPTPFCERRSALRLVGLRRRSDAAGLCDQARRAGATFR